MSEAFSDARVERLERDLILISTAFDSASDAITIADLTGRSIYHNKAFLDLFEYTVDELTQAGGLGVLFADSNAAGEVIETLMAGQSWSGEVVMRNRSGRPATVALHADTIKDKQENPLGLVALCTDITEHRRAEEKLRSAHQFRERVMESATNAIAVIDSDGKFIMANRRASEISGYAVDDLIGSHFTMLLSPADRVRIGKRVMKTLTEGVPVSQFETEVVRKDGTIRIISFSLGPIVLEGNLPGAVGTAEDITERKRAEQALRESEARHRALAETASAAIIMIDGQSNMLFVNHAAEQIFGYNRDEMLGQQLTMIMPEYLRHVHQASIARYTATGQRHLAWEGVELPGLHRSGKEIPLEISFGEFTHDDQRIFAGIARDITGRKRAEQALRESESRYRNLVENSQGLICTHDMDGTLLSVNQVAAHLGGYEPSEMVGRNLKEFLAPDVKAYFEEYLERIRQEPIVSGILRGVTKNGEERLWAYRNARCQEPGQPPFVLGHAIDVTDLKKAERRIREQATLLDQAQDAIFGLDLRERLIYWNKGAERTLGWTEDEVLDREAAEVLFRDTRSIFEEARKTVRAKGSWHGELPQRIKDGTEIIIESRWTLVRNKRGKPRSIVVVSTDITEKKRLAADLVRAAQLALIGKFATGFAHEIKNPLAGIQGIVDTFLSRREPSHPERKPLEMMRREVAYIDTRVRALLEHARPRAFNVAAGSLTEVVRRAVLLGQHQAAVAAAAHCHKVSVEFEEPPQAIVLPMDAAQIESAVLNLVINGIEAIESEGRVTVRLRLSDERDVGVPGAAIIEVEDTGCGIAEENRMSIFRPFFTTKPRGTGLGLSAVRWMADAYGGRVQLVKTELGSGSTFALSLPLPGAD